MTKEILKKITTPRTYLSVSDISVEEKKEISAMLMQKGFTISTFYLRFFQKGFTEWEIIGVRECKKQFLQLPEIAKVLLEFEDEEDPQRLEGDKGYFYTLAQSEAPGVFYRCLQKVKDGLCNKFFAYMGSKGMSPATVIKRFSADDDWKQWELEGIKFILEEQSK